jgi:EpsD family peptidyl-prolyl cis-trans isomerase
MNIHKSETRVAALMILGASLMIGGCAKKPGGQVVAVVNSQEITQQDVKAQAMSENINSKDALDKATPRLVQQLVDRTILAQYGHDQKIDRSPEYIARRRQMDESLLSYLALRKLVGQLKSPTNEDAKRFIATNPLMFADRQRLTLDQVRFAAPSDTLEIKQLTQSDDLGTLIARLNAKGIKFTRSAAYFDTGTVDPKLAAEIVKLGDGELFNLTLNGTCYMSEIKGRARVAGNPADWGNQAIQNIQRKSLDDAIKNKLTSLKAKAKVSYDAGYQPTSK